MKLIMATLIAAAAAAATASAVQSDAPAIDVPVAVVHRPMPASVHEAQSKHLNGFRHVASYVVTPRGIEKRVFHPEGHSRTLSGIGSFMQPGAEYFEGVLPQWGANATTVRDRLLLTAQAAILSFPEDDRVLSESSYGEIFSAGDSPFGDFSTAAEESAWRQERFEEIQAAFSAEGIATDSAFLGANGGPTATAEEEEGVAADVFRRDGATVLHFRGSYSDTDFYNIRKLYGYWFQEKSRQRYMDLWEQSGQTVSADQESRSGSLEDFISFGVRLEFNIRVSGDLPNKVWNGVVEEGLDGEIDQRQVATLGQWVLTKTIVRELLPKDRDLNTEGPVYITGYSQGGLRAQLAAMMLAKEDKVRYNTTTLAGTGAQCASRRLWSPQAPPPDAGYLPFVDLNEDHSDHIVSYHDVLDPFAAIDLVVGRRCAYGAVSGNNSRATVVKYCEKIVGYSLDVLDAYYTTERRHCTYFTHGSFSLERIINNTDGYNFIRDDGSTDIGCQDILIPLDSTAEAELCPTGEPSAAFVAIVFFFIALPSFIILLSLLMWLRLLLLINLCSGKTSARGLRSVGCGCCCCAGDVNNSYSMFPHCCCLCNAPAEAGGSAGIFNRLCCCCGAACKFCGLPCCPPSAEARAAKPAHVATASYA